ncbi:MAG: tRNA (N6-isopentenyl adenosine(37)-C2)-methylthiotransferase MiaB [Flavobacteriaceae bacterium]|nr:tRNA (N6-isopentenyl adenosine(37)-C2)-methylthiotransferase MiaB [Flavobacteriaceae bacterium]
MKYLETEIKPERKLKIGLDKIDNERKFYIESYGCQMNFADSEIVSSIVSSEGYTSTKNFEEADLILLNTCSIREKAETTVRNRLKDFSKLKTINKNLKVGVLGCMAERLKNKFLDQEKIVDLVVGPDAYRDIPNLLEDINDGKSAVNVILSKEETYGDISPVRLSSNGVTAFVSITRGCDNMCTFCVVPFTRGRERSRDPKSILKEIQELVDKNYKEVTLLGQNVDSYLWYGGGLKKDYTKISDLRKKTAVNFAKLLKLIAQTFPKIRIRFSTSNPQDMNLEVIKTMSIHQNICKHIHLPVQSGSDKILKSMNRKHSRLEYLELIKKIKELMPDCAISHDMITGFPNESDDDHKLTLDLMEQVKYEFGYMFKYSERPGTLSYKKYEDNVPEQIKKSRLQEIVDLQQKHSLYRTESFIGKTVSVLIEKESKKSKDQWSGRNEQNTVVVFDKKNFKVGDFVDVHITDCTSATLIGDAIV